MGSLNQHTKYLCAVLQIEKNFFKKSISTSLLKQGQPQDFFLSLYEGQGNSQLSDIVECFHHPSPLSKLVKPDGNWQSNNIS